MPSFEDLGVAPEVVEALAAEGIEAPTELQRDALPVLLRGNSLLLRAGPGAGVLACWGPALLERVEAGGHAPGAVVLTADRERAEQLAISLARLAPATGHRVGVLGGTWALPAHADILFATPRDLADGVRSAEVKLERLEALVLDGAAALMEGEARAALDAFLEGLPPGERQWIVTGDPLGEAAREFVKERLPRAVALPPEAAAGDEEAESPVRRGTLEAHPVGGEKGPALLSLVAAALEGDHRHVLLFFRSDDGAADGADLLGLHGYVADAPGALDAPVWLGSDPLEARGALEAAREGGRSVLVVSVDVPPDGDTLDRRHGGSPVPGAVLARPRELPHLRRVARSAGYDVAVREPERSPARDRVDELRRRVEAVIEEEDLAPWLVLLEPLIERRGSAEVAAALALLLQRRDRAARVEGDLAAPAGDRGPEAAQPPAWVKLFLSVGRKDGAGPGDLVGAITGEAGVDGEAVGRIEVRETFSRVDIRSDVAARVIEALNGVTIRGRSVRADYDRAEGRAPRSRGMEGSRRGRS